MSGSNSAPFDMRAMLEALTGIDVDGVATGGGDKETEMQESRSECEVEKEVEKEKKEEAEKIDVAPSRFRTWRGLQNVPTGPANPRPAPTQPRSPYQTGPPSQPGYGYGFRFPPRQPYGSFPPSPYQAPPAAPPAVPASVPSQPQQPQDNGPPATASVSVPGKGKVQKSGKALKEKKKREEEKKKREAEFKERERKREEKERREEEERRKRREEGKERREEEREERRREREEERRRDEERRREESEREDCRHRQFLEMMAAQETARSAEAVRLEALRADQAARDRTLASLSAEAIAVEQRFVGVRSHYLRTRDNQTDPDLRAFYQEALVFIDGPVLGRLTLWRSTVVAELGNTSEADLSRRLLDIEREAMLSLMTANPPVPAPVPAPTPAPTPAPAPAPALPAPPAPRQLEAANPWGAPPVTFNIITNGPPQADPAGPYGGQPWDVAHQQHLALPMAPPMAPPNASLVPVERRLRDVDGDEGMTDWGDDENLVD